MATFWLQYTATCLHVSPVVPCCYSSLSAYETDMPLWLGGLLSQRDSSEVDNKQYRREQREERWLHRSPNEMCASKSTGQHQSRAASNKPSFWTQRYWQNVKNNSVHVHVCERVSGCVSTQQGVCAVQLNHCILVVFILHVHVCLIKKKGI